MNKSYIWSLPTRAFHWLFVVGILVAFLTDDDHLLNYHAIVGYALLILLAFRILWGVFGPKYSKFKDFPTSEIKQYSSTIFSKESKYIGHNPAASYIMIIMLVCTFLIILTGVLTYGIQEGKGILGFLNETYFKNMKSMDNIHEFFANFFIFLIVLHLIGIVVDKVLHKEVETLKSICTGYKNSKEDKSIKLNIFQKLFAGLMFILLIAFLVFNLLNPKNMLVASINKPIDYKVQNEFFVEECASCHTLYPTISFA
ncbi:cytochrome b/b6 domain-containing protein [Malaciobacter mytili]|uniref:cytochrome b/b6 domain-containing protein n=1 Tax=Malaciobacter mytili TaxID=603050 RepID=UPI003A8562B1